MVISKRLQYLGAAVLALLLVGASAQTYENGAPASIPIRLVTHNIRYAATNRFDGEEPWQTRRPLVVNQLRFTTQQPPESMICMQEVLNAQLLDVLTDLNAGNKTTEWAYIGVGRDDGIQGGEYSPIFYRPSVWALNDFKTVWLSETPEVPSKGWDAGSIRLLTIGTFTHKATSRKAVFMCTHLDNAGTVSRLNSAKIIIDRINLYTGISDNSTPYLPVLLGGDFNSELDQEAYLELSKEYSPVADVRLAVPESSRYGNVNTFTGFTDNVPDDSLIDFIWLGPKNSSYWTVSGYGVLANKFDDGIYNSDHRAVAADVILG